MHMRETNSKYEGEKPYERQNSKYEGEKQRQNSKYEGEKPCSMLYKKQDSHPD